MARIFRIMKLNYRFIMIVPVGENTYAKLKQELNRKRYSSNFMMNGICIRSIDPDIPCYWPVAGLYAAPQVFL